MFRMDEVKNSEQMEKFREEAKANPSGLYWSNKLDEPSPFADGLHRSNVLDFTGFQLVLKLPGTSREAKQLLIMRLSHNTLQQILGFFFH